MTKDLSLPTQLPDGFRFTPPEGLTEAEAAQRAESGGANRMTAKDSKTLPRILLSHTFTLFNLLNLALGLCLLLVGNYRNMLFLLVVVWNVLIGTVQEYRAWKTISSLRLLNAPAVHVLRGGEAKTVSAEETVQGDLVVLRSGDQVPADAVIVDGFGAAMESLLTGESQSVPKQVNSWLYSGSYITEGRMTAQLVYVGDESYIGRLTAEARKDSRPESRLMTDLKKLIRRDTYVLVPLGLLLFLKQYLLNHIPLEDAVPSSVAAMIGMIPEGLILLTSVAMAVGVVKLGRRETLVQELSGIETLARADTLCLDKTGTITTGKMELVSVVGADVSGPEAERALARFLGAFDGEDSGTLSALREKLIPGTEKPRAILPFSSDRKKSAATFYDGTMLVLGAPEFVLGEALTPELRSRIEGYTAEGQRVLVLAEGKGLVTEENMPRVEKVCGLCVLSDQLRPGVDQTLRYFRDQDVDIRIISGDSPVTVSAIARRAGLPAWDRYVDLSAVQTEEEINELCDRYTIFGRVTPEQKKMLVLALKRKGHNVAMTGDGVNDIPALKTANCSIAMAGGADAAKNAAQLTLLNSDFSSLPEIVLEGRRVINNVTRTAELFLTKTVFSFLLSVLTMFIPSGYPFQPIQLTLVSSLMIGLPGFFLALEPSEERVKGRFLRTVLTRAMPGGIAVACCAALSMGMNSFFSWPREVCSTLATLSAGLICWMVLLRTCLPLNRLRRLLLAGTGIAFILAATLAGGVFFLVPLEGIHLAALAALACLGGAILFLGVRMSREPRAN